MPAERFDFPNPRGEQLAALLDRPEGPIRAVALFAHCFTCGKDIKAARLIAQGLKLRGVAVLRFDFTGLGASEGEFANTTFSSNVDDLVAAADHLRATVGAPAILIGHSLGGAAVLAAVAPHRRRARRGDDCSSFRSGACRGTVRRPHGGNSQPGRSRSVARRPAVSHPPRFARRHRRAKSRGPHRRPAQGALVFHSPTDDTVGIDNASKIFLAAKHPKSFISLSGADHLLRKSSDAVYVAHVIAAWAERYLDMVDEAADNALNEAGEAGFVIVRETRHGNLQNEVVAGVHRFLADEPVKVGGLDSGPGPYDLLLAALGACTSMTVRLYADRKQWPLKRIMVRLKHGRIYAKDCAECETKEGMIDHIDRVITFEGELDAEQRKRLMEIADKCPVHRNADVGGGDPQH